MKDYNVLKLVDKKNKKICLVPYCRKPRDSGHKRCCRCRHRYKKLTNEVAYVYGLLKSNAKRRGKEFTLSFDYFKKFCEETGYIENRGKAGLCLTIDRIDSSKGYIEGNIQVLTHTSNSKKQDRDDYVEEDLPF